MSAGLNPGQRHCNSQQLMHSLTPDNKVNKMTTEYSTLWGICIEHHHPQPQAQGASLLGRGREKEGKSRMGRGAVRFCLQDRTGPVSR